MGKIVSIHSYRGGTGKSTTTANLAAQAAMAGKRVGMVDTDIQSPGIHVLFGLDAHTMGRTLNEFLRGECTIEQVAFAVGENTGEAKGRKQLAGKNLWLVPSSIETKEITDILKKGYDPNLLNEGLQTLLKKFELDYLFIDTHPGLNEETLLSIVISDILIILLRPDEQDYQGTAVTVDVARLLEVPHLFLLINRQWNPTNSQELKDKTKQLAEENFQAPVLGVLPFAEDLLHLGSKDILSLYLPDRPWSMDIRSVAKQLLEVK